MNIKGKKISFKQLFYLTLYYSVAIRMGGGKSLGRKMRVVCARNIFKYCAPHVNIERGAIFGVGLDIELGEHSGLGKNCYIPSNTKIGDNVMMGPNCYIFDRNHGHDRTDIPMIRQGMEEKKQTIIEDDVWIGRNVMMTPGRHLKKGTIIAAGCVLCKDFPEYSIVGGNPSRLIKRRIDK